MKFNTTMSWTQNQIKSQMFATEKSDKYIFYNIKWSIYLFI